MANLILHILYVWLFGFYLIYSPAPYSYSQIVEHTDLAAKIP